MRELPEQVIGRKLGPGEKLLWAGVPPSGIIVRPIDCLLVPYGLFICGFVAFWGYAVMGRSPVFFVLWLIPCVLGGVYTTVGRFIVDAWLRANTNYGVTDQRIIIASGLSWLNVAESFVLDSLRDVRIAEQPDGRGTITFGAPPLTGSSPTRRRSSGGLFRPAGPAGPSFERIENPRIVYDIIERARAVANSSPS